MKTLIPWLCVVVLLGSTAFFYSISSRKDAELASLRASATEVEKLRSAVEQLKDASVPKEEMTKLRQDAEDVLRLRKEVVQLRDTNKQLTQQAQAAEDAAEKAKARAQADAQRAQQQMQAAVRAQAENAARATVQAVNACVNNLRQLDGAKQQWALENGQTAQATPTTEQVAAYLRGGAFPVCPAGGQYALNAVGTAPTCSIQGHALQQQ
jgi:hypothetical protein